MSKCIKYLNITVYIYIYIYIYIYTVIKTTRHQALGHNFTNYYPIFEIFTSGLSPMWARGRCRISPPCFLAECCKKQLNQGSFILLYFRLSTFSDLYCVCLSVFSCIVCFVSISQVTGCEYRLRHDLYCVEWGVKLYSNQPLLDSIVNLQQIRVEIFHHAFSMSLQYLVKWECQKMSSFWNKNCN